MEIKQKLEEAAKKVYPIYGAVNEKKGLNGQFKITRQSNIDKPILNPEYITGKLLWYTTEGGYDYCHPFNRAKERAGLIVEALNKSKLQQDLEEAAPDLYEMLVECVIALKGELRKFDTPDLGKMNLVNQADNLINKLK